MPTKKNQKQSGLLSKILILVGILLFVVAVYLIKNLPSKPAIKAEVTQTSQLTPVHSVLITTTVLKAATATIDSIILSPEAQLDQYLMEGKPTFVFFHSTNCHSCIVMMETVNQVYPEFKDSIALVDVNVYDKQNENLLRRGGINSIPTLMFINSNREGKVSIGVIEADVLRQQLTALKEMP